MGRSVCLVATLLISGAFGAVVAPAPPLTARIHPATSRSTLAGCFEPNLGQTDPRVRFLSRRGPLTLFLTASGAVLRLTAAGRRRGSAPYPASPSADHADAVRLAFEGSDPHAQVSGEGP